ncbi:uncharacterized protein SPPG_04377 [Spizellomyces punctatus DAOM BR117]|uniref:Deubiquitinating enzyme MINDY-3/4 conserved domain-containing protein n=1 Tax=Spizellomyces punctatus (strain DAOM BR117) TaxID=645134 RepID=A0A0L0HG34_SPIPD|nr:uncharacterized protein SPPG_04377 [Spizellomyces punctatus DAOM BR117]KND00033.1 hypothetical protein SPPG_04377 [Spizellomyces punctatus DAOM BR117]|eukprot:XP_016608072.1 hypothetical protein SPPG_04377 [Spizellomyces punctatus DAOM BR117]
MTLIPITTPQPPAPSIRDSTTRILSISLVRTYLSDLRLKKTVKVLLHELSEQQGVAANELGILKRREVERALGSRPKEEFLLETLVELARANGVAGRATSDSQPDTMKSGHIAERSRISSESLSAPTSRVKQVASRKPMSTRIEIASPPSPRSPMRYDPSPKQTLNSTQHFARKSLTHQEFASSTQSRQKDSTNVDMHSSKPINSDRRPGSKPQRHNANDIEITSISPTHSDTELDFNPLSNPPPLPTNPTPLTHAESQTLHNLLWDRQKPPPAWLTATLTLNTNPSLPYGLVQTKGGPCGVLAGIQASLIKVLVERGRDVCRVSRKEAEEALWRGVAEVLWRAGGERFGRVVVGILQTPTPTPTPLNLTLHTLTTLPNLTIFLIHHRPHHLLPLLYSLLLTHTPTLLQTEMDDPSTPLIATHGYCTQDLVNLILTGQAVSNVFNGTQQTDGYVMKGVQNTPPTGFLSLFESYGTIRVGSFYKFPKYPIWTIHSESHYTTLFSPTALDEYQKTLELIYYDGLANQDGEIRIRVICGEGIVDSEHDTELIPPLERCVRTRWKGARVEWVGCEPIL